MRELTLRFVRSDSVSFGFVFSSAGFSGMPLMPLEIHAAALDARAFAFEQPPLQTRNRLLRQEPPAGADDAMPRDALSRRARRYGKSRRPRASGQPEDFRQLAVGDHAAPRDAFDKFIDLLPAILVLAQAISPIPAMSRLVIVLLVTFALTRYFFSASRI